MHYAVVLKYCPHFEMFVRVCTFKKPLRFLKNPATCYGILFWWIIYIPRKIMALLFSESTIPRKRYCNIFANSANFSKVQISSKYYGIIYPLTLLVFKFYPSYGSMFGRVTNSTKVMPLV